MDANMTDTGPTEPNDPIIFKTVIGSHMWKMATKESDTDYFYCRAANPASILDGTVSYKSTFKPLENVDIATHEAKIVVEQLLKGNINFLVGVMSPNIVEGGDYLDELRFITMNNIGKNIYHSIHGMAVHNNEKYILSGKDTSNKRCNIICRTLQFGANILNGRDIVFHPFTIGTPELVIEWIEGLDEAYNHSELPELPSPDKYRAWLLKLRTDMLDI